MVLALKKNRSTKNKQLLSYQQAVLPSLKNTQGGGWEARTEYKGGI